VNGNKKDFILWAFFADLGNRSVLMKSSHDKVYDFIAEGIMEKAKDRVKVIDGGERILRYIHPSLNATLAKKNLKVSLEDTIAARKPVLDAAKKKGVQKYFELGGTFGLYQDINKLGCSWGVKADGWCAGTKGSCDEKTDTWQWADPEQKRWCSGVEVKTLEDHLPLLQRLFGEYEYVWSYSGDGKPVYNELGPDVNPQDREKFRSLIVRARSCGTNGCEERMGESERNCPADCSSKPKDTTPPERFNGLPNGVLPAGTTQTEMSLATNENATCKYSANSGVAFPAMDGKFSKTDNKNHSVVLKDLTSGKKYNYFVKCKDRSDNENADDYKISFSVADPAAGFNFLYKEIHSFTECQQKGGQVLQDGADNFCKFAGSGRVFTGCPTGWEKFKNWSITTAKTCNSGFYIGFEGSHGCTTGKHNWANIEPETCSYSGQTCNANITAVGCY
jgi:hypothetical protein